MTIFDKKYSELYEAIYAQKDYQHEVETIQGILGRHSPAAHTLLNFGCGTGKHDFILANAGFQMVGIDRSGEMLAKARGKGSTDNPVFLHIEEAEKIENESMDAILCLFDVFSYFVEDADIFSFFDLTNQKTKQNAPLIFDFWYLPSVVNLKPETRKKVFHSGETKITRITEPSLDVATSCVQATHEFFLETGIEIETFSEKHRMRCFTRNEIQSILSVHGYELQSLGTWNDPLKEPNLNDWSVLATAVRRTSTR